MRLNYKTKTALSSEEKSQKEVISAVKKAALQLQADLLSTEESLEESKAKLEELETTYPLDTVNIIKIQCDIESLEDGIKRLKELKIKLGL